MTTSLPALFEAPPRASSWAMAGCFGLSLLFLVGLLAPSPRADDWGGLVTVSSTMGVQDGRLCTGEGSRGDIGCPAYAPYVSRTTGYVGIGTSSPISHFHLQSSQNVPMRLDVLGNGAAPLIAFRRASGSIDSPIAVSQDNSLGGLLAAGYGATNFGSASTGAITFNAAETFTDTAQGTYISFATTPLGSTIRTERVRITANGNVGISTSNPTTKLEVAGTVSATAFIGDGSGLTNLPGNTTPDRLISGTTQAIAYQNTSLSLVTAGTERMVIGTGGNIGIGSQPIDYATLTVSGSTTFTSAKLELMQSGTPAYMAFVRSNGTTANKLPVEKGNTIADLIAWPFNGTTTTYTAGITYLVDEDIVAGVVPTAIRFTTRNVSNTYGERVRIASNGNVGIGTSTPAEKLDVAGNIKVPYNFALISNPLTANPYLMRNFYDGSFDKLEIAAAGNSRSRIGFLTTSANGTSPTERLTITHGGSVGIGILTPTTALDVSGTVSATTLQLADNPSNPCNAANKGMAKVIDGRIYVCRYP